MTPGRSLSLALAVATALGAAAPSAHAFRMIKNTSTGRVTGGSAVGCNALGGFAHWRDASTSWFHNTTLQGSGKAAALQGAMAAWTGVTGTAHRLNYSGTTSAAFATDGRNTLLWSSGNGCTGNCLALTALVLQSGQAIVESDVTFNNAVNWTIDGADFDTQSVATHELGHALGIHHTDEAGTPTPSMNAAYFGVGGRSLSSDDEAALQCSQSRYPPNAVLSVRGPSDPIQTVPGLDVVVPIAIFRGPGFTAPLDLSVVSLPLGVTASLTPDPATGSIATLSLTVGPTVVSGGYAITVQAAGGGESATDSITLAVRRLVVTIDDGGFSVLAGEPAQTSGVTLLRAPGFTEPVTLTIEDLPLGQSVSASVSPTIITGTTSTLRVSAGRFAPGGSFTPTLRAGAASASDSQTFGIEVVPLGGQP